MNFPFHFQSTERHGHQASCPRQPQNSAGHHRNHGRAGPTTGRHGTLPARGLVPTRGKRRQDGSAPTAAEPEAARTDPDGLPVQQPTGHLRVQHVPEQAGKGWVVI